MNASPLREADRAAWASAQGLWGVRMRDPHLLPGKGREVHAPAWFTFPPLVAVDPEMLEEAGVTDELESIFAHELGHHVVSPSTRIDSLKIRHQMARAIAATGYRGELTAPADLFANLWSDLLVNTQLAARQRRRDLAERTAPTHPGIVRASQRLFAPSFDTGDRLWWVYLRAYELLWNLPDATLCAADPPPAPARPEKPAPRRLVDIDQVPERHREAERALRAAEQRAAEIASELSSTAPIRPEFDVHLIAQAVRSFAGDPVSGALRFAVIAAPYLADHDAPGTGKAPSRGRGGAGAGNSTPMPGGVCAADEAPATPEELGRVFSDRRLHDPVPGAPDQAGQPGSGQGFGVARTLGLYAGSDRAAVRAAWYRSQAGRWVRPFTERRPDLPSSDLPGPLEVWQLGDDIADIDWSHTLQAGAVVVPGVTTRRRSTLDDEPVVVEAGIELDLYIDSSGSMPHPDSGSPAVLAGTILALSVLRGGGRVRVTSFSGAGDVAGTVRFTRNSDDVITALCEFFGRGTTFPLDLFGARYDRLAPPRDDERRHVVVLSDDGLVSMFGVGNEPFEGVARRVRGALTTGTLVLLAQFSRGAAMAAEAGYDTIMLPAMDAAPAACARLAEVLHG